MSNRNQERFNLEVKEEKRGDKSKPRNPLNHGVYWSKAKGLWSLEVLENWRSQTRSTKRLSLDTCIYDQLINSYTKTWLDARVLTTKET